MAILVNKMNREVKVIIPNMREFRVFYSDNEGSVMFFKRDWTEEKQEGYWRPNEEQMKALEDAFRKDGSDKYRKTINSLYQDLKKL